MSETSPRLSLPLVMPDQAQKHVTVNEALLRLDALVQLSVESRTETVQPAAPLDGQVWVRPAAGSGDAWSGFSTNSLAVWRDGYWSEVVPQAGWRAWLRDEDLWAVYRGGSWMVEQAGPDRGLAAGASGAETRAVILEEELTALSGAIVQSSIVIPSRAIVLGVSVRTGSAIGGASSFDCGIAGEPSKFGGSLGVLEGDVNIGVIGPQAFYADTPIVLTAAGGDFSGGAVTLAIHALLPRAPV